MSMRIDAATLLNLLREQCHKQAKDAGWWSNLDGSDKDIHKGLSIALMHSELSEALEGVRKNAQDEHLPHRSSVEVELADTLIRIFDFCGAHGLDIGGALVEKLEYNKTRADHTLEARQQPGGKDF